MAVKAAAPVRESMCVDCQVQPSTGGRQRCAECFAAWVAALRQDADQPSIHAEPRNPRRGMGSGRARGSRA
jgi:hypothetical protein